ncbi:DUF3515 family protein [Streptomyces sp. E11-3]|uniref:DUF3515 family protein n=1 Tax=Streptomyces sp. E11-3 TaxID=3110112 RepID=UPI00398030B8
MGRKRTILPLAAATLVAVGVLAFVVTSEPHYDIRPGAEADSPHCARMTEKAPAELAGQPRHSTGLSGVVVWGDNDIVLRCGVPELGPTTDPCFAAEGVDWVIDSTRSKDAKKVITTYGRAPATEVTLTRPQSAPDAALIDLSALVAPIKQTEKCIESN